METELDRARAAAHRQAWAEAARLFAHAGTSGLGPSDLALQADAAWWLCRIGDAIDLRQRAYAGFLERGQTARAGYVAWLVSLDYGIRNEGAIGAGWLRRAQRHLAEHPDTVERGFVALTESDLARDRGELELARERAQAAVDMGDRHGSLDLHAMGLQTLGRALIAGRRLGEGLALLDEAMSLAVGQRLSPMFTGVVYCNVVAECMACGEVGRAGEWTRAALRWCGSIGDLTPYHGICRLHHVELAVLHGRWDDAQSDAVRVAREMEGLEDHVVAAAYYAAGEVHLRRGDAPAAEDWFLRAQSLGRDPQPGLAILRLSEGKLDAAAAALRVSLLATTHPGLQRARLLAAYVDVSVAQGNLDAASGAAGEIERDAIAQPETLVLAAHAAACRARVCAAAGEPERALREGRQAWSLWRQLEMPYEAARARVTVGAASAMAGDGERAAAELTAALEAFERLGASRDAREVSVQLRSSSAQPAGLTSRELDVLRHLAAGKTNREIAAALVISERTVSRHLEHIFRKLHVTTRAAAAAEALRLHLA